MKKVILNPELQALLNGFITELKDQNGQPLGYFFSNQILEICDESGNTLGMLLSTEAYRKPLTATQLRKIVASSSMRSQWNELTEQMEVCDDRGQTVGHYFPAELYRKWFYAAVESSCPFSKEEMEKRRLEKGGRTLAKIWKSLGVK